jgi:hypothetical protein
MAPPGSGKLGALNAILMKQGKLRFGQYLARRVTGSGRKELTLNLRSRRRDEPSLTQRKVASIAGRHSSTSVTAR